jgi:hypothetical protein
MAGIIDAHIHIMPPPRLSKAIKWIKRYIPSLPFDHCLTQQEILSSLDDMGVSRFFNYVFPLRGEETRSLNRFNWELGKNVRKAVCFASIHPDTKNKEKAMEEALTEFGLAGIKLHPFIQDFHPLDSRMEVVYRFLSEVERPLVIHTGFDGFYSARITTRDVEHLLNRFPSLQVVACHMFYPDLEGAFRLLADYPNLLLDGSNVFSGYRQQGGANIFTGTVVKTGNRVSYHVGFHLNLERLERYSDRILFGSDYPLCMNSLERIYSHMAELKISEQARKNIMYNTAFKLIKHSL